MIFLNRPITLIIIVCLHLPLSNTKDVSAQEPSSGRILPKPSVQDYNERDRQLFTVIGSDGAPSPNVRFYESYKELQLSNKADKSKYLPPSALDHELRNYGEGMTNENGEGSKLTNTAMFMVSESNGEIAFIPPRAKFDQVQLRECGTLKINTQSLKDTNTRLNVLAVWKNCLAGCYPVHPNAIPNWKLTPYFTIVTRVTLREPGSSIELMLPPGEVTVCVLTQSQMEHFNEFLGPDFDESELLRKLPSTMGVQSIRSGETTVADVKLGWCITGTLKYQDSPLPDWSNSTSYSDRSKLLVSSSGILIEDEFMSDEQSIQVNKGDFERMVTDSYIEFLTSEKGKNMRGSRFRNVPAFVNSQGKFTTLPLPPGSLGFHLSRIDEEAEYQGSVPRQLEKYFHLRKKPTAASLFEVDLPELIDLDSIQGSLGRMDVGVTFVDNKPFSTRRQPKIKAEAPLFAKNLETPVAAKPSSPRPTQKTGSPNQPAKPDDAQPRDGTSFKSKQELERQVSAEFDERHQARIDELNDLQAKIEKAKSRLERRQKNRDLIIKKRVKEIWSTLNHVGEEDGTSDRPKSGDTMSDPFKDQ